MPPSASSVPFFGAKRQKINFEETRFPMFLKNKEISGIDHYFLMLSDVISYYQIAIIRNSENIYLKISACGASSFVSDLLLVYSNSKLSNPI